MFRRLVTTAAVVLTVAAFALPARAQVAGNGTLAGRAYFDLARGMSDANEKEMTFAFRRIYFTYNMTMSDHIKGRFRTDVKQDADGKYRLYIKHAYADWKVADMFSLRVGVQGTILFGEIEDIWAYRHIEKTLDDLYKTRSSADFGLSGNFSLSDMIALHVMVSNGEGYDKTDDGYAKAYEVQGVFTPIEGLMVSAHYGMNGFDADVDGDGDPLTGEMENTTTMDLSVGYEGDNFAVGGSYTTSSNFRYNLDQDASGFWGFGRFAIPNSPLSVLGTWMSWDPDRGVDDDTETTMIVGLDYSPGKGLSIIPNFYQTKSGTADPVNTFRITFYWKW